MEAFWAILITLGIIVGAIWLVNIYLGWTVIGFLLGTLFSLLTFAMKGENAEETHPLDTLIGFLLLMFWGLAAITYWADILNSVHPFYTFILAVGISYIPLGIAWWIFARKPVLRFLLFFALAGTCGYLIATFPVFNNDLYRYLHFERPIRPTVNKMLAADINQDPLPIRQPVTIIEQRQRTPNEKACYSSLNEQLGPSVKIATRKDEIKTIIYLSFTYDKYSSYEYYQKNSPTVRGEVCSYQHFCRIYIWSPELNQKHLYATIQGPAPRKPTDSSNTWGDRVTNRNVIDKLKLLLKSRGRS